MKIDELLALPNTTLFDFYMLDRTLGEDRFRRWFSDKTIEAFYKAGRECLGYIVSMSREELKTEIGLPEAEIKTFERYFSKYSWKLGRDITEWKRYRDSSSDQEIIVGAIAILPDKGLELFYRLQEHYVLQRQNPPPSRVYLDKLLKPRH